MTSAGTKRARLASGEPYSFHQQQQDTPPSLSSSATSYSNSTSSGPQQSSNSSSNASSSFRNVSACNRCRLRKNRCDQNLPACTSCEKAGVKCVGFDPITKREIPRTYVYYLESRVRYLENLLGENNIKYAPSNDFDLGSVPVVDPAIAHSPKNGKTSTGNNVIKRERANTANDPGSVWEQKQDESDKLHKLVSNIGMVSVQGASDPRFLGSTSGISFARVVFAAVKSAIPGGSDKIGRSRQGSIGSAAIAGGTSMRDSFFGLQTKPSIKPAPFPDRDLGLRLVNLYFEHANPQIPILHRPEFMVLFGRAYAAKDRRRSARELYMLNIVFAIGAGTILEDSTSRQSTSPGTPGPGTSGIKQEPVSPTPKKIKTSSHQRQPEEYHASAMVHLESFLGSMPAADPSAGVGGGLEQLQAVLLLASFALLRPVAPGLWYITGVAVRLGVDLGLHYEDGAVLAGNGDGGDSLASQDMGGPGNLQNNLAMGNMDLKERGRQEWIRDLRRRLWWCVYSFDRLVSTCVGRPFGITDAVITTAWPTVLDDKDITPEGFTVPLHNFQGPSYKRVSHHYFRLRLLQSEILQVLQYRQAQKVHAKDREGSNPYMHTNLSSAFLGPFVSFQAWRKDIDRRLWEWKETAPLQQDIAVNFSVKFLELNYWQAVIMLYRQSLSVPPDLAHEIGPHNEVESPMTPTDEEHEHHDDIFLKVAEAGQRVLKLYRQLHRVHLVNYTYLATVHLFMAGIAFLYSIWHSRTVRSRLTHDDIDLTVLAATSVLTDLIDKCPPAEACRDAFSRMAKATIKMCLSTTGFGSQVKFSKSVQDDSPELSHQFERDIQPQPGFTSAPTRPPPQFDYNLKDLFPDTLMDARASRNKVPSWQGSSARSFFPSAQRPSFSFSDTTNTTSSSNPIHTSLPHSEHQSAYDPSSLSEPTNAIPVPVTAALNTNLDDYDFDFDLLMSNMNNDASGTDTVFTGDGGLDPGFGGTDPGNQQLPDLFGGFFFGGPQGDMGMEMAEGEYATRDFGDGSGNGSAWGMQE